MMKKVLLFIIERVKLYLGSSYKFNLKEKLL